MTSFIHLTGRARHRLVLGQNVGILKVMLRSFLNLLLIVLLFFSTIGYVAYQLVAPDFLASQAENVHLYQQATGQISSLIPTSNLNGLPLSATDIQNIVTSAVDANTFYTTLHQASNAYLDYLTGRSDKLSYTLNLNNIKVKIGDQATASLIASYQRLPICKTSELKSWDAANNFPTCQLPPTNVQQTDINALLGNQVNKMLVNLPNSWSAPAPTSSMSQTRGRIMQVLGLIRIAWLTTLGVIALYVLILRRRAYFSLALIFLVVGLLEVAFSLVAWDYLKRLIIDLLNHPGTSQQIITMTSTVVDDVVQTLKTILGNLSIITMSIGGLFLIIWGFTRFSRPKNALGQLEIPRR